MKAIATNATLYLFLNEQLGLSGEVRARAAGFAATLRDTEADETFMVKTFSTLDGAIACAREFTHTKGAA